MLLLGAGAVWGQLTIQSGATLYIEGGGTVYSDDVDVTNAGTIAGKGTLQIHQADFTNTSTGTVAITIGPTSSTHTTINCQNGTFTPGGNFTVTTDNYSPAQNDVATIVNAGILANSFFSNPSSNGWYGNYNYPAFSGDFAIRFGDANTWTGLVGDNNWFSAGNWSLGMVPTSSQDVVLTGGTVININSGSAVANTITTGSTSGNFGLFIDSGASLTASSLDLTAGIFWGYGTFNGNFTGFSVWPKHPINDIVGTLTINGNATMDYLIITLNSSSTFSKLVVSGAATVNSTELTFFTNYGPSNGEEKLFLDAGSVVGPFASSDPATWALTYNDPSTGDVTATYVPPPPSNDNCAGAQSMTPNNNYNGSTASATQGVSPMPSCHGSGQYDLWYSFTAPAGGTAIIKNYNNNDVNALVLYSGSCGGLSAIKCVESVSNGGTCNQLLADGLTPGNTYYVQIVTDNPENGFNFYFTVPAGPANDFCAGAIPISVGAQNACPTGQVSGTTVNANHDMTVTCDNNNNQCNYLDVWYSFTAPASGSVKFIPGTNSPVASFYSGSCGSLSQVGCLTAQGTVSLMAGNTYYVKIATYDNSGMGKTFSFCLEEAPTAPANNNCDGAILTSVNANGACNDVSGTTVNATLSKQFGCSFGGSETYLDVWYSFVAPTGGAITFNSGAGHPFAVVYPACPATTPVNNGCMRGSGTVVGLTGGATYYLQVLTSGSSGAPFTFCLEDPGAAPSNNGCASAIQADLGNPITVNSLYALTNTLPPCANSPALNAPDLWYTFTAASNTITYTLGQGTLPLTIYSGTCGNLVLVTCAIPFFPVPTNLIPGDTYYAQINSLGAEANGSATISAPNTFTFTGAVSNAWATATNWTGGAVPGSNSSATIGAGETCTLDASTTTGSVTVQTGSMFNISDGVVLTANGGVDNNGTIAPGNSPGCATITGNFTNAASGTLAIEVNGKTTPCTDYDKLTVTGTATIGSSTLTVAFGGGYTPTNGDKITFLQAASISGTFTPPSLPTGWAIKYDVPGTVYLEFESLLPIELVSFRANIVEDMVQLDWQTASELNNRGFEVQRSTDAIQWELLHFENGNGTSTEVHHYSFLDEHPLSGTNYYRLQQMDFDGHFEYSPTVSVEMKRKGGISVFPNPASDAAMLYLETDYLGEATLTLYDLMGRQVKSQPLNLEGKALHTDIDLTDLPGSGMYLMVIEAGQQWWQQRVVVE